MAKSKEEFEACNATIQVARNKDYIVEQNSRQLREKLEVALSEYKGEIRELPGFSEIKPRPISKNCEHKSSAMVTRIARWCAASPRRGERRRMLQQFTTLSPYRFQDVLRYRQAGVLSNEEVAQMIKFIKECGK